MEIANPELVIREEQTANGHTAGRRQGATTTTNGEHKRFNINTTVSWKAN